MITQQGNQLRGITMPERDALLKALEAQQRVYEAALKAGEEAREAKRKREEEARRRASV